MSTHSQSSRFTYEQMVLKMVPDFGYLYSEDGIVGLAFNAGFGEGDLKRKNSYNEPIYFD